LAQGLLAQRERLEGDLAGAAWLVRQPGLPAKMRRAGFEEQASADRAAIPKGPEKQVVGSGAGSSAEISSERTVEQVAMQAQIQRVLRRLDERRKPISNLQETVVQLATGVDQFVELVGQAQKQARNLGEDLLDDMLVLDKMSGLAGEDRASRKATLAAIQAVLEEVDAVKGRLGSFRNEFQTALQRTREQPRHAIGSETMTAVPLEPNLPYGSESPPEQQLAQHSEIPEPPTTTISSPQWPLPGETDDQRVDTRDQAKEAEEQAEAPAAGPDVTTATLDSKAPAFVEKRPQAQHSETAEVPAASTSSQRLPLPQRSTWEDVKLALRFRSQEDSDSYVVRAEVPGLDVDALRVQVSSDGSNLVVTGLCLPTAQEAEHLRQQLATRFERIARFSPGKLAQIATQLDEAASEAYAEMGRGRFGRFSASFQIPRDVDTQGIDASYRDDVLFVVLPRGPARFASYPKSRRWMSRPPSRL